MAETYHTYQEIIVLKNLTAMAPCLQRMLLHLQQCVATIKYISGTKIQLPDTYQGSSALSIYLFSVCGL